MKILGAIISVVGWLGFIFVLTEVRLDWSFFNVVLLFVWLLLTQGIGKVLMNTGENNGDVDNK